MTSTKCIFFPDKPKRRQKLIYSGIVAEDDARAKENLTSSRRNEPPYTKDESLVLEKLS
jgi:hypothetical protein